MDNLRKRIAMDGEDINCSCCKREMESVQHLFLGCGEVSRLWYKMTEWIGVSWAAPRFGRSTFEELLVYLAMKGGLRRGCKVCGFAWYGFCGSEEIWQDSKIRSGTFEESRRKLNAGFGVGVRPREESIIR